MSVPLQFVLLLESWISVCDSMFWVALRLDVLSQPHRLGDRPPW